MSNSGLPPRRRRIAGESQAGTPVKKVAAKKVAAKKVAAKKVAAKVGGAPKVRKAAAKTDSRSAPGPDKAISGPMRTAPKKVAVAVGVKSPTRAAPRVTKAAQPPLTRSVEKEPRSRMSRPPRRELRWLAPAILITVASLALGVVLTVRGMVERGADSNLDSSNSQAASAARKAATTIFSFRYDKLDEHQTKSTALMTRSFAKKFNATVPALKELAPQRKIVTQAVAREAAAVQCGSDCSTTKATVLVFYDQVRIAAGSKEPTVFGNRITVSLVKQGGTWLVADIRAL